MEQHISLREANQNLSRYIKTVETGSEVIITRRGQPVAKLVPIPIKRSLNPEQTAALERTKQRMQQGYHLGGKVPVRDDLHEC